MGGMGMGRPGMGAQQTRMGPGGPVNAAGKPMRPKVCEFFSTERGCVKGDVCEFVHQKQKPCEFFASARGCRKGDFCDFQHEGEPGGEAAGAGKVTKATPSGRYAPY